MPALMTASKLSDIATLVCSTDGVSNTGILCVS